ncbi:amino acid adenylation domain-containing protein [Hyunsoonleella sp. 2307UL5-6]|uniref:amino acid adenylation domain-containing protein n=1 Tax=Hyunsoonleella sp. 2307UL5-6 TaxID=3384768 RepID=UPI0039BD16EE
MIFNLVQIIENSAKEFPDKQAFKCLDASITFSELNVKANQLAKYLTTQGVEKGDRVGILMHRCLETAIAIYGIMKSGGVYVPIDPFAPVDRIKFLINDCQIKHLVTTEKQNKKIKKLLVNDCNLEVIIGASIITETIAISWNEIYSTQIHDYNPVNILAEDLAYILYTSGSTGVPKGIMHTHASGLAFAKLVVDLYGFKSIDIVANSAPLHFDVSILGYCSAPLAGATTVIVSDAHLKFPASLADLASKEKVTIWYSVPLLLIELLYKGGIENKDFTNMRWVLFAGEVFATKQLRALMQLWEHATFSNIYGPTETNQCTYYNLTEPPKGNDPIPIGYTWANTEYKILDEEDKKVKKGNEGLLVIRSATMMKGYWNNPALTEASLYKEKIASGYHHIYYRTGDLVKLNEKNELLFLGRKDNQIKFRGFRIEIGEIENTLLKHKDVIEAAVLFVRFKEENQLIGIVLVKHKKIAIENLMTHCKNNLPAYAVPSSIQILDDLPRTSSGKVDRKKIEHTIKNA